MNIARFCLFVIIGLQSTRAFSYQIPFEQWDWQAIENVHGKKYQDLVPFNAEAVFDADFRLAVTDTTLSFLFLVHNLGDSSLVIPPTASGGNLIHLHDASRNHYNFSVRAYVSSGREVPVGAYYQWRRSVGFYLDLAHNRRLLSGNMARLQWRVMSKWAPPIWIAFPDENGHIEHVNSMSEEKSIHLVLASVYSEGGLAEVACILINQTDEAVSPEAMPGQSLIRITALDVPKEHVIPLSQLIDPQIEVAAGGHHIWRLPWSTILNAIDEATMAGVLDAGVRIDLTWQLGEHTSTVLPIAIMPPTERERGQ